MAFNRLFQDQSNNDPPPYFPWKKSDVTLLLDQVNAIPNFHLWLFNKIDISLDFARSEWGVCKGFADTATLAFWVSVLTGEDAIRTYLQRIIDLQTELPKKTPYQKNRSIGFFDSMTLFQECQLHNSPFLVKAIGRKDNPQLANEALEALLSPSILDNNCQRTSIYTFVGAYTHEELLTTYFNKLIEYLGDDPFELSLSSGNHAISLCFCPASKNWLVFNANQIPLAIFNETQTDQLVLTLRESLFAMPDRAVPFGTTIKSTVACKKKMLISINKHLKLDPAWKRIHNHHSSTTDCKQEKGNAPNLCGYSLLHIAASAGCIEDVNALLNNSHMTSLAEQGGHPEIVKLSLDYGAKLNQASENGLTPFYMAVQMSHIEIVKFLLEKGADINRAIDRGTTPLYIAAQMGYVEIVKLLLENGAKLNQAAEDGATPLLVATKNGHVDVVKLLLDYGADSNKAMKSGGTPLYAAAQGGHLECAKLLLDKGADINQACNNGTTSFYIAIQTGHADVAKLLLNKGADINRANEYGYTPLMIAAYTNQRDIVEAILASIHCGVELLNHKAHNGNTAFTFANHAGNNAIANLIKESISSFELLRNCPIENVDLVKFDGVKMLFYAAQMGRIDIVKLTLEQGVDINQAIKVGANPLYAAVQGGRLDIVKFLIEKGVDVNNAMKLGATPLFAAAESGHLEIAKMLLENGAHVDQAMNDGATPLYIATQNGHTEIVKLLLDYGADVDKAMNVGATPLFAAAQDGHLECAKLLLNKNADINRAMENGITPLYIAAQNGHSDVFEFLLEHGADIKQANMYDQTPLMIAVYNNQRDIVEVILASTHCDVELLNHKDHNGNTVFTVAKHTGNNAIANLIEEKMRSFENNDDLQRDGCAPVKPFGNF